MLSTSNGDDDEMEVGSTNGDDDDMEVGSTNGGIFSLLMILLKSFSFPIILS